VTDLSGRLVIFNLHGYASSGNNMKYLWLRGSYPDAEIISPTIDYNWIPEDNLSTMESLIKRELRSGDRLCITGTSMGGFFAYCLCAIFKCTTVLFNPALLPFITLRGFSLPDSTLKLYAELFAEYVYEPPQECLKLVLGENDDVVNHRDSAALAPMSETLFTDCGHIIEIDDRIAEFVKRSIDKAGAVD
jgi:predicted esterase YcpF (UPF0227 family)